MDYIRLDPLINGRPKMMRAGWWARQLYLHLLVVSGKYDLRGRIGPQYADEEWLALEWGLEDFSPGAPAGGRVNAIRAGMSLLLGQGLLTRDGEDWIITGWEEFYGKRDHSTPRVQAYRARQRGGGTAVAPAETAGTPPTHPLNTPTTAESGTALVEKWNEICGGELPRVTKLAGRRKVQAEARLKEYGLPALESAMRKMMGIPGLLGKTGKDTWKADFDWFVGPLSVEKIASGKYDQWGVAQQGAPANVLTDPMKLYEEEQ